VALLDGSVVVAVLEKVVMIPLLMVEVEVLVDHMLVEVMELKVLEVPLFLEHMD
tara:strand:- start:160 stop:321 length:162 start_codon:yes stop_codon:yes gene_type:complete